MTVLHQPGKRLYSFKYGPFSKRVSEARHEIPFTPHGEHLMLVPVFPRPRTLAQTRGSLRPQTHWRQPSTEWNSSAREST
ncbi:hypothetical protein BaRGS_00014699 [Batillaria attramentaria]|uniref:Uncharacterized protein n=1 Tax=Batillaria attramentaria TaxID=370345 RepID=A0ABD0L424_9CAEN